MKKLSNIKVLRIALSLIILLSLSITPAFAKIQDVNKDSKNYKTPEEDKIVGPQAVYDGNFWFTPQQTTRNSTIYAEGEQYLLSIYPADGYFEMLLDAGLNKPSVVAREGVPLNSFNYAYHPNPGEYCWVYDSGARWYMGTFYMYLKASTSGSDTGIYWGRQGSDEYIPDLWYYDDVYISS